MAFRSRPLKYKYFLTPQGLALKARLTQQYMEASLRVYRELRRSAWDVLAEVKDAGYASVHVEEQNEVVEIFRLTCLEQGVKVASGSNDQVPTVGVDGTGFVVRWPEQSTHGSASSDETVL